MSDENTHFEREDKTVTPDVPAQPVTPELETKEPGLTEPPKSKESAEQNLGAKVESAIGEKDDKSPNEIYRLGNLISPTVAVDYLAQFSQSFPKPKMKDGEAVFATADEQDYATDYSGAVMFYTPGAICDRMLEREGAAWQTGITRANGEKRVTVQSHAKSGTGASALLRRIRKTGAPITLWLPHTGIYVTFEAPKEEDYCEYDIQQTMEAAEVGRMTHGLLMNMASGIYLQSQVEFALRYAVSTSYDCEGGDIAQTLVTVIKQQDYGKVITGPTIAKFPSGIPWTFLCPDGACRARHEKTLNLARALRDDDNALSPAQREFMDKNTRAESVTAEMLETYQSEFRRTKSTDFIIEGDCSTITIEFKMTELHEYFTKTKEWVRELSDAVTDALAGRMTAHERQTYMRQRNEARRLTRYAHMVKSITVSLDDGDEVLKEVEATPEGIVTMLSDLTNDREVVNDFEEAIQQFIIDNTHSLIAYKAIRCPTCAKTNPDALPDGAFRGLVPISPDRIFFALSQQVSTITSLLSNRSD